MEEQDLNVGASTSSAAAVQKEVQKEEKKRNQPWIEKYRPHKFEEIMGENRNFSSSTFSLVVDLFR